MQSGKKIIALLALIALACTASTQQVMHIPLKPVVYAEGITSYLQFDFYFTAKANDSFELESIELWALDKNDQGVYRRTLNRQALGPGMATLPTRVLTGSRPLMLFNPFYELPAGLPLNKMVYGFTFHDHVGGQSLRIMDTVSAYVYKQHSELVLPVKGSTFVYDGHDFYSHHRRVDLTHPVSVQMGLMENASRFAIDLCTVGKDRKLYRGKGNNVTDWYGWGQAVYAPGNGTVVAVVDSVPDNDFDSTGAIVQRSMLRLNDPSSFAGNYIIIDHGMGEFSLIAHFRKGSIPVKKGQRVVKGQRIGDMGFSGSTGNYVHCHYELRNSAHPWKAEGLPAYFSNCSWLFQPGTHRKYPGTGEFIFAR